MSLKIVEPCVNCFACLEVCPSDAIVEAKPHFLIEAKKALSVRATLPSRSAPVSARLKRRFLLRMAHQ